MRSDGKPKPHVHSRGVAFDRNVDVLTNACKFDNALYFSRDVSPRHAQHASLKIDVLATAQFRMEARTNLHDRREPSSNRNLAGRWSRNGRQQLQYGALTCTVVPDEADRFSCFDFKADVTQRPDFFRVSPQKRPSQAVISS